MGCLLSTLLSMVILWAGLGLWIALTWAIYQNSKGHSGRFAQWIPKQPNTLNVSWDQCIEADPPNEVTENSEKQHDSDKDESTTIHVYTNPIHQWWTRSAFLMLGTALIGWVSVYFGWVPVALTALIIPCIVGLFGHKDDPEQQLTQSTNLHHPDAITLTIPPEASWMGLHTWLQNHQVVLPVKGTIVLHHSNTSITIPFVLPVGFTEWTVQSQLNPIEA